MPKIIEHVTDTECSRKCCWTPTGVCAHRYQCAHHATDYAAAVDTAIAGSLRLDQALRIVTHRTVLTASQREQIIALRGVETATVVAERYEVTRKTVSNMWSAERKRRRREEARA